MRPTTSCNVKMGSECSNDTEWMVGKHPALCFPCLPHSLSDRCASLVIIDLFKNHFARGWPVRGQILGPKSTSSSEAIISREKTTQMPRTVQELPKSKAGIACLSVLLSHENEGPKGKPFPYANCDLSIYTWSIVTAQRTALPWSALLPPTILGLLVFCHLAISRARHLPQSTANLFCYSAAERHSHRHTGTP